MASLRVAAVALAVLLSGMVAAAPLSDSKVLPTTGAAQDATPVDTCTTITEPGTYELTADLEGSDGPCLHVRESGVAVRGNGYAVRGNGTEGSVGILVYAGASSEPTDASLRDVTVQNVTASGWERGIQVGDISGIGTNATLSNATVTDNDVAGVYLVEAENATVDGLDATGNGNGVILWEVQNSALTDVTATDNRDSGVALMQDVYGVEIRGVTATGNGDGGYSSGGVYASTDARRNVIADAVLSNNEGAGLRFSDSGENVLRDAVVEGNTGPGVHGIPANEDDLRNVTMVDNGGPALSVEQGQLSGTEVRIDARATASFESQPVTLDDADASVLQTPPSGELAADSGVNVTGVESGVTVTISDVNGAAVELWRYGGETWTRVDDTRYDADAGTVSGTVREEGVVAAVRTSSRDEPATTATPTTTGPTTTETTSDGPPPITATTGPVTTTESTTTQPPTDDGNVDEWMLGVLSTRADHDFAYVVVVNGDAEKASTEAIAADSGDRVLDNGDGTVTIVGTTGDESGDAFRVDGTIESFYTPASPSDYVIERGGEDVTDDLPGPN